MTQRSDIESNLGTRHSALLLENMSPDPDGDSQMLSSPDVSDVETPPADVTATLSPPSSQSRNMPIVTAGVARLGGGASIANSNGKRPLNTISNGTDEHDGGSPAHKVA
jgi:hypothetical protein